MEKVKFVINFDLNLLFHLEVISGSVPQRFNKKYASSYSEFEELAKEFRWEFDPQTISWSFKKRVSRPKGFEKAGIEFSKKIKKIYEKAKNLYRPYWETEIKERLEDFRETLEKEKGWIEMIVGRIEKFTGIPFPRKTINIYLIEALSEEYGIGAEPLGNGIAIGRIKDSKLLKKVIAHELVHLNLMDRIIKRIPLEFVKEESQINEAITDLIAYRISNLSLFDKRNPYVRLFWPYFQQIEKIENLENFLANLWKLLPKKNRLEPKI